MNSKRNIYMALAFSGELVADEKVLAMVNNLLCDDSLETTISLMNVAIDAVIENNAWKDDQEDKARAFEQVMALADFRKELLALRRGISRMEEEHQAAMEQRYLNGREADEEQE